MKTRGRKSAAELEKVSVLPQHPEPPASLSKEQKEVWNRVVRGLQADWFGQETHDLLEQYCRHVSTARKIGKRIDRLPADAPIKDLNDLTRMRDRETARIAQLATKMRIAQQSTYDQSKVKRPGSTTDTPWPTLHA